jgi:RHS repeat-associated protein
LPGESLNDPPTAYSYNDAALPTSRTGRFHPTPNPADEAIAVTYFDGHGKEFQQRVQVSSDQFVVSGLRLLNPWGDLKEEYEPTFDNTASFGLPSTANRPRRQICYDALGRTIRIVNFNGGVSTAEYSPFFVVTKDANDNDESPENVARGQYDTPHREEFDVFRYRTRTVEDLGGGQSMEYSYLPGPQGELLQVNDDHGVVATYQYDRLGQRLLIQHREAGVRCIWYDGRGEVIRTQDANGNDLRAEIDARRRLTRLHMNGAILEEYTYDDTTRHALGRLSQVTYPGGRQCFSYDAQGRLEEREYQFDGLASPQRLSYSYDRLGREIAMSHYNGSQAGLTVQYELTANGWVRAMPGFVSRVRYDPRGLPSEVMYQNGVITQTTFTPGPGRVAVQSTFGPAGQVLEQLTFEYDHLEMLLSSNDTSPGGCGRREFSYDPLYQIISAIDQGSNPPVIQQYTYAHGMNLSRFDEMGRDLYYDDLQHPNRLAGLLQQDGSRFQVNHDNNGNLVNLPDKTFRYNAKNELIRFDGANGLVAEYQYDHQGMRISKIVTNAHGAVTRTFFLGDSVEVRSGQPAYFVRLGALRVAVVAYGQTRFVHGDHLGSTAFFTDEAGTKIAAIAYRPFGNVASSNGEIDFRTFGVHPFDSESGLIYMRRRYYAPEIGRFLTPDPLALYQPSRQLHNPRALHPYAFVANDPLNKTDLTGLSFWSVFGAIIGVIAAIAVAALVVMTGGLLGVLIGAVIALGVLAVSYVIASETAGTPFGDFMRGFLIGLNAGLNAVLASVIFGPVVGVTLGVINFLAAFDTVANSRAYQGILGWSSWLMPMSWLATGVGLVFFLLNVIPVIFTGNQVEAVKIHSLSVDWKTGTIVMEGGWTFLSGFRGGFNLGNLAYITPGSSVTDHEVGHTLNVAAFGSIFHFIGAIDENAVQSNPSNAYAERLADSHDPNASSIRQRHGEKEIIPMWT